jgi:hypothetical protein
MGNCSLMGSKSLIAISRPLLAPWASSSGCLIVPNGPPVFVWTSNVPAECHLHQQKQKHTHTHTYLEPHTYFNHYHSLLSNSPKKNQIEKQRYPYANLSMRGAQCFSAMRPLSFLLHFSTAFWYSSLTVG